MNCKDAKVSTDLTQILGWNEFYEYKVNRLKIGEFCYFIINVRVYA